MLEKASSPNRKGTKSSCDEPKLEKRHQTDDERFVAWYETLQSNEEMAWALRYQERMEKERARLEVVLPLIAEEVAPLVGGAERHVG